MQIEAPANKELAEVLAALAAEFPKQLAVILPRYQPAPLAEAIEAGTPEEGINDCDFLLIARRG